MCFWVRFLYRPCAVYTACTARILRSLSDQLKWSKSADVEKKCQSMFLRNTHLTKCITARLQPACYSFRPSFQRNSWIVVRVPLVSSLTPVNVAARAAPARAVLDTARVCSHVTVSKMETMDRVMAARSMLHVLQASCTNVTHISQRNRTFGWCQRKDSDYLCVFKHYTCLPELEIVIAI